MAEQLNTTDSETIYVDFSSNSMEIAQRRSKVRGSLQIVWITAWIEQLTLLGLGEFDLISSSGVLHHLRCPQKGLNILNNIQSENGGALISVYGKYARSGVYQIQELMRKIQQQLPSMENELENTKIVLSILPLNHWFHVIRFKDTVSYGDHGIYDLLLHKRDVSYTIPDFNNLILTGGYNLVEFSQPEYRLETSLKMIINDNKLFQVFLRSRILMQRSIGELISGKICLPELYVSNQRNSEASEFAKENVVFSFGNPKGISHVAGDSKISKRFRGQKFTFGVLGRAVKYDIASTERKDRVYKKGRILGTFAWPFSEYNNFVLKSLTIFPLRPQQLDKLTKKYNRSNKQNITFEESKKMFHDFWKYIKETGLLFLRHKSVSHFPLTCCFDYNFVMKKIKYTQKAENISCTNLKSISKSVH